MKLLCKSVTVKPDTVIDSVRTDPAATGRCFVSAEAFLNFGGVRCHNGLPFCTNGGRMKTGLEDCYVIKNNKKLRLGYTTGSCAAGAAKAAAKMLLTGERMDQVELWTPKGILLNLQILDITQEEQMVSCAVRKDGGDDPDMTNQMLIYATVRKSPESGIFIDGGPGVGRVTRPGLEQPVGNAAINRVPREMIERAVRKECEKAGYEGGISVVISAPEGEKIAQKTFNPRLGIVGGISILGTSGIVEPMSEAALIRSIEIEMDMQIAQGAEYLLVTPGNYGRDYLKEAMKQLPFEQAIKCSNYVGETLDMAVAKGVKGILFVSHIGKFVKVAAGIMNTHSHQADARMEVLASNAIRAGADLETARKILAGETTDEALEILKDTSWFAQTMKEIAGRIQYYLNHHTYGKLLTGAVIFSNTYGFLAQTESSEKLIEILRQKNKNDR